MASLKDIRVRINSVKSTQKITNAMKLVSAAKFARASHAVQGARPYSLALNAMVKKLASAVPEDEQVPLLSSKVANKKVLLAVVSTDRGLCGPLNSNLFKEVTAFLKEFTQQGFTVDLLAWGKRATSFCTKKTQATLVDSCEKALDKPDMAKAIKFAGILKELFVDKQAYEEIYIVYPKYVSALDQQPTLAKVLPISVETDGSTDQSDIIVEPGIDQLLAPLLARLLNNQVFQILLEGAASEHGARMTAMDAATGNAKEVIKKLTLQYNRARQAAITTELTEIISGAEALN